VNARSDDKGKGKVLAVPVQVSCSGYRCLAYKDKDGVWLDYFRGSPLSGSVQVVDSFEGEKTRV